MEEIFAAIIGSLFLVFFLLSGATDLMVPIGNWLSRRTGLQGVPGLSTQHSTGVEGILMKEAVVLESFQKQDDNDISRGRVRYNGEIWEAFYEGEENSLPVVGDRVQIRSVEGLLLSVTAL